MSHFAAKPPLGGRPISDRPPRPSAKNVIGMTRAAPENFAILSCPSNSAEEARGEEHRGLGEGVGEDLHQAAVPPIRRPGVRPGAEREHQEEIADLGDGRIGDEELEARLAERHHAAEHDRRRPERAEDRIEADRRERGQDGEPEPHDAGRTSP